MINGIIGTTSVASILNVYTKVINKLSKHQSNMAAEGKEIDSTMIKLRKERSVCTSEIEKAEKAIQGFKALVGDVK